VLDFDNIGFIFRVISDNKHPQEAVVSIPRGSDKEIFGQDEALFFVRTKLPLG
jgi:hypothetical protein